MNENKASPSKSLGRDAPDVAQEGQDKKESQVYTYTAPWNIYSMGFSSRPDKRYRMGIGSFLEDIDNKARTLYL